MGHVAFAPVHLAPLGSYIPLGDTHVYLTAVMDWSSRYVISWRLSNSLDKASCIECLEDALQKETKPEIFN